MFEIPLTQGFIAHISNEDADLAQYRWYAVRNYSGLVYAARSISSNVGEMLHSVILCRKLGIASYTRPYLCDHVDRNGLNNQRENLRLVTQIVNTRNAKIRKDNKSGVKGVSWDKRTQKWEAQIGLHGRRIFLGAFDAIEDAISARLEGEKKYWDK